MHPSTRLGHVRTSDGNYRMERSNLHYSLVKRVSPLKTETIVRLELAAAVLSKRLRCSIIDHTRLKFEQVFHIVDSEIVRAMINKDSYGFNTFVATRVGEIQDSTDPSEWFWIKSELNIADILRGGRQF